MQKDGVRPEEKLAVLDDVNTVWGKVPVSESVKTMPPVFPPVERIELAVPMLELVICQVRFPRILALTPNQAPADFQQRLRATYPIALEQNQGNVEIGATSAVRLSSSIFWAFQDRDAEWTVSLSPTFLSLETNSYLRFNEFIVRFADVLAIARDLYPIEIRDRLGLRYVDRVSKEKHPGLSEDWPNLLPPVVLPLREMRGAGEPQTSLLESRFAYDDRVLAIRALYQDQGFEGTIHNQLILDFDCYSERRGEFEGIEQILREYHDTTYRAFRWMVGDLIVEFGRVDQGGGP